MQEILTLFNECWFGAATSKHYLPAILAVADRFARSNILRFRCPAEEGSVNRRNGIDFHDGVLAQIAQVWAALKENNPSALRNLGCDCGTEFAPIAHLLSRYRENLVVIWFDAHADLNLPKSPTGGSPSGHFHGMVLRALTGHAAFGLSNYLKPPLLPSQIVLAGARELDPEERGFVETEAIPLICSRQLGKGCWHTALNSSAKKGMTSAYIHIDFDVVDPQEFPWVGCPTPGGVSTKTLRRAIADVRARFNVVGISAVEVNVQGENAIRAANIVKEMID